MTLFPVLKNGSAVCTAVPIVSANGTLLSIQALRDGAKKSCEIST